MSGYETPAPEEETPEEETPADADTPVTDESRIPRDDNGPDVPPTYENLRLP
jgi:hypothetical protein